jgi:hypothetical protein
MVASSAILNGFFDPLAEVVEQCLKVDLFMGLCCMISRPILAVRGTFCLGFYADCLAWRCEGIFNSVYVLAFESAQGKIGTGARGFFQIYGILAFAIL